jgi:hypothetical protein
MIFALIGLLFFTIANRIEDLVFRLEKKKFDGQWPKEVIEKIKQEKQEPFNYNNISETVANNSGQIFACKLIQSNAEYERIKNDFLNNSDPNKTWDSDYLYKNYESLVAFYKYDFTKPYSDINSHNLQNTMFEKVSIDRIKANNNEFTSALIKIGIPHYVISLFSKSPEFAYQELQKLGYSAMVTIIKQNNKLPWGIGVIYKDDIPVITFNYYSFISENDYKTEKMYWSECYA